MHVQKGAACPVPKLGHDWLQTQSVTVYTTGKFEQAPGQLECLSLRRLRINTVLQKFTRLESHGITRPDFHRFARLRILALPRTTMPADEGPKTNKGDGFFAMEGAGDFFQNGVEDPVCLFLGEVSLLCDSCGEFGFTHE